MAKCNPSPCIKIVDCFFCLFIFMPLAVLHWRGTWDLLDLYIVPQSLLYSSWATLLIGAVICSIGQIIQPYIYKYVQSSSRCTYIIVSRLQMYFFAWSILCYWRGLWNLVDLYFGEGWKNSLICYIFSAVLSVLCLTSRTNAGLPLQVQVDIDPELMHPDTRFFSKETENLKVYSMDVCFTQLIVVSLNILVWRGIWNILDAFLFPHEHLKSDIISLIIGYSIMLFLFLLQYPLSSVSAKLDDNYHFTKLAYEDIIIAIATWGVVFVWRGEWDIIKAYFIPNKLIGGWSCHWIGTIGLMLLQGFANVGTNGIDIDGSYSNGEALFPTDFFKLLVNIDDTAKNGKKLYSQMSSEELHHILMLSDDEFSIESDEEVFSKSSYKNGHFKLRDTEL